MASGSTSVMTLVQVVVVALELLARGAQAVTYPPNIYLQPALNLVYKINESVKLPCVADGNPTPTYTWYRQGNLFNPSANANRYAQWPNTGTLIINNPQVDDDGMYQCFATNKFGTSVSYKVNLRRGDLEPFATTAVVTKSVRVGSWLRLYCNPPQSYPPATIYWAIQQINGNLQPLMYNSRVTQDLDGNLYFVNVLSNDTSGDTRLVCVVNNEYLRLLMTGSGTKLLVDGSVPPSSRPVLINNPVKKVTGLIGGTVMFKCIFGGYPTPIIIWIHGNNRALPSDARLDSYGQTLIIPSLKSSHNGSYECRGNNDQSQYYAVFQFQLDVESAPSWIEQPIDTTAGVGDTVIFICDATGLPAPKIEWFMNGVSMVAQAPPANVILQHNKVYFSDVQLTDATSLQCNASNKHGYVFADVFLNVLNVPPSFVRPPMEQTFAAERQSVTITCQTFSPPPTRVLWYRDSKQITGGRYTIQSNGDLYIPTLSVTDSGSYTCLVSNKFGNVSATGRLIVRRATQIRLQPTNARIYQTDQIKFQCTAIADPMTLADLKYVWQKDGDAIDFSQSPRIQLNYWDNSMIIAAAMYLDTGQYTCTATNGIDQVSSYASLVVQAVPQQVLLVQVDCSLYIKDKQAVVSWDAGSDNYAPVLVFIIEYATLNEPGKWYPADVLTNITQTVQGARSARVQLHPFGNYTFRVFSRNVVGTSDPSPSTTSVCSTNPAQPDTNPQNVRGFGNPYVSEANIWIQWTPVPPIRYNARNLWYLVRVRCLECNDQGVPSTHWHIVRVENPTLFSVTVLDMVYAGKTLKIPRYRWFRVQVQAENTMGVSSVYANEVTAYSSEMDPSAAAVPQSLATDQSHSVTSNSVALTWNAPSDISSSVITGCWRGYRVEWWLSGDPNPDANKRFQDFTFPLGKGTGGTNCYELHPNADLQSIIDVKSRKRRDAEEIDDGNTKRRKRQVTAPQAVTTALPQTANKPYHAILSNLPGAATITIAVRVLTMFYAGPASSSIEVTTLTGVPGPCNDFEITEVAQNYVTLKWTPPLVGNGEILGYQLATQIVIGLTLSNLEMYPILNDSSILSGAVSGLRPNTTYRVYVWAFTSEGNGEASYLEVQTAPPGPPSPPTYAVTAIGTSWINVSFAPSQAGVPGNVYYAQWRKSGRLQWLMTSRQTAQRWIYITGLQSGMTYDLRMVSENGVGNEAAAASIGVTTAGESAAAITPSTAGWLILLVLLLFTLITALILLCFFKRKRDERERGLFMGTAMPEPELAPAPELQGAFTAYSGNFQPQADYGAYPAPQWYGQAPSGAYDYDPNSYPFTAGYAASATPAYDQYRAPTGSQGSGLQAAYSAASLSQSQQEPEVTKAKSSQPVFSAGPARQPEPVYEKRMPTQPPEPAFVQPEDELRADPTSQPRRTAPLPPPADEQPPQPPPTGNTPKRPPKARRPPPPPIGTPAPAAAPADLGVDDSGPPPSYPKPKPKPPPKPPASNSGGAAFV